ncbi:hypothetical protein EGW08_013848 [Elysia chlorotica]|uniref:Uncharacterized protein n=1 Tax=Elysia chlorotica TaxID=188477 RepID=A0A3S0ZI90_ELYCH|nr:hypothetical protein EGW08_013848 [Elysia chlorotica]
MMRRDAKRCGEMQRDAERCREMRRDAERCGEMRRDAERCGEMRRDAERCGEMRRDAERCREIPRDRWDLIIQPRFLINSETSLNKAGQLQQSQIKHTSWPVWHCRIYVRTGFNLAITFAVGVFGFEGGIQKTSIVLKTNIRH